MPGSALESLHTAAPEPALAAPLQLLRRYTHALSLLHILKRGQLTLLPPTHWYDQNDALSLELYSRRLGDGKAYALCLAEARERAHHWQLFAGDTHGVCIFFHKEALLSALDALRNPVLHGPVEYRDLPDIRGLEGVRTEQLPFLKRNTFSDEHEYRVVAWQNEMFATDSYMVPLDPAVIIKVTTGPSMPEPLAQALKDLAHDQPGCGHIEFVRSRLAHNQVWHRALVAAAARTAAH